MDKLKCPICDKEFKMLTKHLIMTHNLSREEIHERFPDLQLVSIKSSKIRSEIAKRVCSDPEFKRQHSEQFKEMHRNGHNRSKFMREVVSRYSKERMKNLEFKEKIINASNIARKNLFESNEEFRLNVLNSLDKGRKSNWDNPEYIDKMRNVSSESLKRLWSSDDRIYGQTNSQTFREMMSNNAKTQMKDPEYRNNLRGYSPGGTYSIKYKNKTINLRSSLELEFANTLMDNNIEFEYESLQIPCEDKTYYPDFYLPRYNLIIEIHPRVLIDDIMIKKRDASLSLGYNFLFIDNYEECKLLPIQCN